MKRSPTPPRRSLPRSVYRRAQVLGVKFAHQHTADFPRIEEGKNTEEVRLRRVMYLKAWGSALLGFKAGYYAGLRAKK